MSKLILSNSDKSLITKLKATVTNILKKKEYNKLSDFFGLVVQIVEIVEKYNDLSGIQKVAIVNNLFQCMLVDVSDELYNLVNFQNKDRLLLKNQLANLIEVIVKITKGTLFNKTITNYH